MNAIINSGPREDSTRIGRAGTVRRQAVDVSPLRRVNQVTSNIKKNTVLYYWRFALCFSKRIIAKIFCPKWHKSMVCFHTWWISCKLWQVGGGTLLAPLMCYKNDPGNMHILVLMYNWYLIYCLIYIFLIFLTQSLSTIKCLKSVFLSWNLSLAVNYFVLEV